MSINFKTVHTTLNSLIKAKGFTYVSSDKWFDFEFGIFPTALHNNGYALRPASGKRTEEYESYDWHDSPWIVEFCMSAVNDAYLSKAGTALDAVRSLEGQTATNIVEIEFEGWQIRHFDKHVIMTIGITVTLNE